MRLHDEFRAQPPFALAVRRALRARNLLQIAKIARQKRRLALQAHALRHAHDGHGERRNERENEADDEQFQKGEAFLLHHRSPP